MIARQIGAIGFAVEHEVGRQVQQPTSGLRCGVRKYSHRGVIGGNGVFRLILRKVHRRIGGAIDDPGWSDFVECTRHGCRIADIQLRAGLEHDVAGNRGRSKDRSGNLPAAAQHQHSHANFSIFSKLAPWSSFADSLGIVPAGSGH